MRAAISAASWTYTAYGRDETDRVFRALSDLGYEGVELSGSEEFYAPENYPTESERRGLLAHFKGLGLAPCSLNARLRHASPLSRDASVRDAYVNAFAESARFCAGLSVPAIRVDTVEPPPLSGDRQEARRLLVDTWERCARIAGETGVTMIWEYEPQFVFNRAEDILSLLESIDTPAFTVVYDTSHTECSIVAGQRADGVFTPFAGGQEGFVRALAGRIGRVHLADCDGSLHDESTSVHMPIGSGRVDFPAVVRAAVEAGYRGTWWTVDPCFWPDPLATARDDIRLTTKFLEDAGLR